MKIKSILILFSLLTVGALPVSAQKKTTQKEDAKWVDYERQQIAVALKDYHLNLVIADMAPSIEADNDLNFYVTDLGIIQTADSLLSDTSKWNRKDDRNCSDDIANGKYSLFCALYKASGDVAGEYLHRRTVMQAIRFVIGEDFRSRFSQHRLMDFNNNAETSFEDVKEVLKKTGEEIKKQLNEKEEILAVIHQYFDAINKHNAKKIQSIFADGAVNHFAIDRDGSILTGKQSAIDISNKEGQVVKREISGDIAVKVIDRLATAWVPCDFIDSNKITHQSTSVFTLMKSKKGWLITSMSLYQVSKVSET